MLTHAAKYISGTKWMDINRQYFQKGRSGELQYASGALRYRGSAFRKAGSKVSLTDDDVQSELPAGPAGPAGPGGW